MKRFQISPSFSLPQTNKEKSKLEMDEHSHVEINDSFTVEKSQCVRRIDDNTSQIV